MTRPANFATGKISQISEFGKVVANLARWFAKLAMVLRNAQYPAATVSLLTVPAASHPVFNCISFLPLFLCFSIDFRAC